ncbi:MAG: depolymerase [Silanimonas sp.]|nr:MAG: depolymerase [Silanimonas sp.]
MRCLALAPLLLAGLLATGCGGGTEPPLPALRIDTQRVAVAGLSSGAYMATQVHVALNTRIHGAALFAGGPYGCAGGALETALGPCMLAEPAGPDLDALAHEAEARARDGRIDPIAAFAGDRVFLFHGRLDRTVNPALSQASAALYRRLGGDSITLTLIDDRPVGHALPTQDIGGPCESSESPWLARCGIDGAGLAMQALFGEAERPPEAAGGRLSRFDQRPFLPSGAKGLADTGYLYVPTACEAGGCGLVLAFHGCRQDAGSVGEVFVREAGFNRWADALGLVVVYPQARSSYVPLNPNACWDWWGYGGSDYDTRTGGQVAFVAALIDRLAAAD